MKSLLKLSQGIDFLNEWIGRIFSWAIFFATLVSAGNAMLRYSFPNFSSNAFIELQWYLFGAAFMLCSAWTWKNSGHVRIDIISSRLSAKTRSWVEMFCHFFFLLPFLVVMVYLTPKFVYSTYAIGEISPSPGGLIVWPAKALIMAGFYALALQWISEVIKRIAIMRGLIPDSGAGGHLSDAKEEAERLLAELDAKKLSAAAGDDKPSHNDKPNS